MLSWELSYSMVLKPLLSCCKEPCLIQHIPTEDHVMYSCSCSWRILGFWNNPNLVRSAIIIYYYTRHATFDVLYLAHLSNIYQRQLHQQTINITKRFESSHVIFLCFSSCYKTENYKNSYIIIIRQVFKIYFVRFNLTNSYNIYFILFYCN